VLRAAISFLLLFIVSMGAEGLAALAQITGLKITSGVYDFRKDHTLIHSAGRSQEGIFWSVLIRWENGRPRYILFYNPETAL
jgi:hypothetical protein